MADAVLSVEIRAKLDALSAGLNKAQGNIGDFVAAGDRNLSKIEARFESLGKTTKDIAENIKSALGGISLDQYMKGFGTDAIEKSKVEVQKYKEEIAKLKNESLSLSNQIKEKTKALNDNRNATEQERASTERQKKATEAERTEAQRLKNELIALSLEKKRNQQATDVANGSYREAQQRLTALGKSIRESADGFDMSNPRIKAQVDEYSKLNQKLKEFDSAMGNHQRNVGNYERALSGANSVGQEFARIIQDAPYGMRGMGNNLTQMVTQWGYYVNSVKQANIEQGKVTTTGGLLRGILQQMASPINLLTIGVSLATSAWVLYEEYVRKAKKASEEKRKELEKARNVVADYVAGINSIKGALLDTQKQQDKDLIQLDSLWKAYNNNKLSLDQRKAAIKALIDANPAYFQGITDENVMIKDLSSNYRALRDNILLTAKAKAFEGRMGDNSLKIRDEEEFMRGLAGQMTDKVKLITPEFNEYIKKQKEIHGLAKDAPLSKLSGKINLPNTKAYFAALELEKINAEINKHALIRNDLNSQSISLMNEYNDTQEKLLQHLKLENDYENGLKKTKESAKNAKTEESRAKKVAQEQSKIESILIASTQKINLRDSEGIRKTVLEINQKYDNWKKQISETVLATDKASNAIRQLEVNRKKETIVAIEAMVNKSLEEQKKQSIETALKIAESNKKIAQDNITIDLVFARRFDESSSQRSIRLLNDEYKKLAIDLEKSLKGQVSLGVTNVDAGNRKDKLQQEYFEKTEQIYKEEQKMRLAMTDSRGLFNVALERTNILLDENSRKFQAGAITAEQFKKVQGSLLNQQDSLNALKNTYDQFASGVGDVFANMIIEGTSFKNGMESLFKSLVSSLIQQFARLAAVKLFGAFFTGGASMLIPGFSSGGYTGNMPINQAAGIVHGKEFVFDAASTKRIGVDNLKSLQSGKMPDISSFTPKIAKNISNFTGSEKGVSNRRIAVDVNVGGDIRNNRIEISSKRAARAYRKFGKGM